PSMPVNGSVLTWARRQAALKQEDAAHRLGVKQSRLAAWESGAAKPTLAQVRALAQIYRRTPAFFLLPEPPSSEVVHPPDFRGRQSEELTSDLAREINKALARRDFLLNLSADRGSPSLPYLRDLVSNPVDAATFVRQLIGITLEGRFAFRGPGRALRAWIDGLEGLGILVFQMSGIGTSECLGLSIYKDELPVVVLNGADELAGRIFTLIHELAHLLTRSGGVCTVWDNSREESGCNRFAAELLMPADAFSRALDGWEPVAAIP